MLPLRTLSLLLLCLSSGMSATLALYREKAGEDTPAPEAPALDPAAAPAPEEPAVVAPASDEPIADHPLTEAPAPDSPLTEEPVADGSLADEPVVDVAAADAADSPLADEPVAGEPVADSPLAEEELVAESPLAEDGPVVDAPAAEEPDMEVLAEEALGHKAPAEEDEALNVEPPAGVDLAEEAPGAESDDTEREENEIEPLEPLAPSMRLREESSWGLNSIRGRFQAVNDYFDSLVEMVGGRNGVCQYHCRYGKTPVSRPGFQIPEPNGCSNSILGFQVADTFDMGIPAMTTCCDQLDTCYDTCGASKNRCDSKFRWCVHGICNDLKRSLGFVSKVQACESMADALYNTVWTLGCRSYMSSQKAACFCEGEERDEL